MQNGSEHEILTPLARQQVGNVTFTLELQIPHDMFRSMSVFSPAKSKIERDGGGSLVDTVIVESPGVLIVDGVVACELIAMTLVGLSLVMIGPGRGGRSDFFPLVRERLDVADAPLRCHPLLDVSFLCSMAGIGDHGLVLLLASDMFNISNSIIKAMVLDALFGCPRGKERFQRLARRFFLSTLAIPSYELSKMQPLLF